MINLTILTTAITRGEFHKLSIGKFYEYYNEELQNFNVTHIINLDEPIKLKEKFNREESLKLFSEIIPKNINTIIINNNNPGFLTAYKNVVNKVVGLNLVGEKSLIWWFEDDWEVSHFNKNLFNIVSLFPLNESFAFNSVTGSPLGSFRGGPIMTSSYFNKYFNINAIGSMNNTCDPEKQVGRWLSGINRSNGNMKIHRDISTDNIVNIIYFYLGNSKINGSEYPKWLYNNKNKFNENITFNYFAIKSDDLKEFYFCKLDGNVINLKKTHIDDVWTVLNNNGINYVCIKPWIFNDIGRKFNTEHNLVKWDTIESGTSYQ